MNSNAAMNTTVANTQPNMNAQTEANVPPTPKMDPTSISFEKMEHDFGTIEQNTTNPYTFSFTNTGTEPLLISDAKGSCGCTVPEYPREPVMPGEKGEIKVVYSPGKQKNLQTKTVTLTANTEPATTVLRIKANVNPGADDGEATMDPNSGTIQLGS
ncbi:MAG: hypothetical protein CMP59_02375 [Flavobacteriales bacterium]|nr:hypothetical protein [Flavobacteriales bacterium]